MPMIPPMWALVPLLLSFLPAIFWSLIIVSVLTYLTNVFTEPEIIENGDGSPYLIRYFLWKPKNKIRWGRLYLHHIVSSDTERALHDHPWNFYSLILKGGYTEFADWRQIPERALKDWPLGGKLGERFRFFPPLSFLDRGAGWRHRLQLPEGKTAWTLVYTTPKKREWGFYINGENFCHHSKYDVLTGLCHED